LLLGSSLSGMASPSGSLSLMTAELTEDRRLRCRSEQKKSRIMLLSQERIWDAMKGNLNDSSLSWGFVGSMVM
jgi:hypothetical protein